MPSTRTLHLVAPCGGCQWAQCLASPRQEAAPKPPRTTKCIEGLPGQYSKITAEMTKIGIAAIGPFTGDPGDRADQILLAAWTRSRRNHSIGVVSSASNPFETGFAVNAIAYTPE